MQRGACFASELGEATNRLPEDIERALWDGVSRGLLHLRRLRRDPFARELRSERNGTEARRLSRLLPRLPFTGRGRRTLVAGAPRPAPTSTTTSSPRPLPSSC